MSKKYEIDIRGLDVKVVSKLWFGPWHSIMHGVYTKAGGLVGLFSTYTQVLEFALAARHRVLNMPDVLLGVSRENRLRRQAMSTQEASSPDGAMLSAIPPSV